MNIYAKLTDKNLFSSAEQILVNYIIEHNDSIQNVSIRKLSKQSGVSISTIYRVLDKLEVSGFSELKVQLTNHWESYLNERTSVDYNYPFSHHSTHYQILKSIQTLYSASIESTINLIDLNNFLKATQLIKNCENLYLFASSSNAPLSFIFKEQMATIKQKVEIITDPLNINSYLYTISNKDVAIVITYLNRSNYEPLLKILKEKGIRIILITASSEKHLLEYPDVILRLCPYENAKDKIAPYASRLSIQYILDSLYSAQFNSNYDENVLARQNHVN